jgi:hypothetical protein
VELWSRERGLSKTSVAYPPSFYMQLKDPHAHWGMIEGLESRHKVEECSFNTIFGSYQGHRIFASRKVAEKIEKQTRPQIAQLTRIRVLSALGIDDGDSEGDKHVPALQPLAQQRDVASVISSVNSTKSFFFYLYAIQPHMAF